MELKDFVEKQKIKEKINSIEQHMATKEYVNEIVGVIESELKSI